MLREMTTDARSITIRCGVDFAYDAVDPTQIVLLIQPRLEAGQRIESEQLQFSPGVAVDEYQGGHRNIVRRFELPVGRTTVRHDAFVTLSSLPENHGAVDGPLPVAEMTP